MEPKEIELRYSLRPRQKIKTQTPNNLEDEASTQTKKSSPVKKKGITNAVCPTRKNYATILDIPLDIMQEISANLWPIDLLLLARTCKAIRKILMSQSSKSIWKAARRCHFSMIDPPECISEPLYAHLTSGACEICDSKSKPVFIYWLDKLSACHLCGDYSHLSKHEQKSLRELPSSIIKLLSCSGSVSPAMRMHQLSRSLGMKWKEEYRNLPNDSEKEEWVWKTRHWVSTITTHATEFNTWLIKKQSHLYRLRDQLQAHVVSNLKVAMDDRIDYTWQSRLRNMIDEVDARDLNQAWSTLIPPAMLHLEKARVERSLKNALNTFETVFMAHSLSWARFPDHVEIAVAPPLRNAFEAPTDDTFLKTVSNDVLRDAIKTWEEETSLKVLQLMRDSLKNPSLERKDLYLAAAIFFCKQCEGFLHYPEVSRHSCAFEGDKMERFRALLELVRSGKNATSWNNNRQILFRKQDYQAVVDLLGVIDRTKYRNVTKNEMDEKGILVQCLDCRQTRTQFIEKKRHSFSWLNAMFHARDIHGFDLPSQVSWKIPGPDGQALLRAERSRILEAEPPSQRRISYILTERE